MQSLVSRKLDIRTNSRLRPAKELVKVSQLPDAQ
jgi:hypothetical protein